MTSIEKYGCDNPAKSKEIKDKIKDTIYNNHGGKHHMQTDKYQKKFSEISKNNSIIRTSKTQKKILEKYGVNHFSQTDEFKQKIKNTMLDRYGIAHNFQNGSKAREKRKTTMIMKYGVEYPLQNEIIATRRWGAGVNAGDPLLFASRLSEAYSNVQQWRFALSDAKGSPCLREAPARSAAPPCAARCSGFGVSRARSR